MSQTTATFSWDELLELIDARRVIPIVGAELLRIPHNGGEALLMQVLAAKLAERLKIPIDELQEADALNRVISLHIEGNGRREAIYAHINSIIRETTFPTPEPLKKLARIRHFGLFVTTTFDSLLERAINEARLEGAPPAKSFAYAPNIVQDLPGEVSGFDAPVVFHLLGRVQAMPYYVITQEDTLEFLSAMQTESRRPELLFDELKNSSLLLIGNSFPDWLARFFIRLAKGGPLSNRRDSLEIIADATMRDDSGLVLFLKNFSYGTQVFAEGGAVEFVDELVGRYLQRHPTKDGPEEAPVVVQGDAPDDEMPEGAVFISYASEDRPAAKRICDALKAAHVDVWFDRDQLEGGDVWKRKIRRNIEHCSLFMPLISDHTRRDGFFRVEWKQAVERSETKHDIQAFIVPVVIDSTPFSDDAKVEDRFLELQWTRLAGGRPTPELVVRVVRLIRDRRKREKGQS